MSIVRIKYIFWILVLNLTSSILFAQTITDSVSYTNDSVHIQSDTASFNSYDTAQYNYLNNVEFDSNSLLSDSIPPDSIEMENNSLILEFFLRKDSLDVYSYSFFSDSINYRNLKYVDTSNHTSDQYNPVKYLNVAYNDLGVIASAQENQIFTPSIQTGFNIGINNYNAFIWRPQDIRLFDTRTPYTELLYLMGPKKENALKVSHAQSFLDEQLSISFRFQMFNQIGYYNHQRSDVKSFNGGAGYRTKDSRYSINAQYYHNKQVLDENGGIYNLSDFEDNLERNRQIIATNLSTGQNFIRISGAAIEQVFYLSKAEPDFSQIPDTNIIQFEGYSVTHFKKPYFDPVSHLGQIKHYFNYERNNLKYTDQEQDTALYEGIPFYPTVDSSRFFDSIGMKKYQNEFIYSNGDYKDDPANPKFLNYFFGGRHEYTEYTQAYFKKDFQHIAIIGGAFISLNKYLALSSDVAYYLGDYLNNDFLFNARVFLKYKKNNLSGGINISHRSADWLFQEFSSSRFTWFNNFDKTDIQQLFIKFERKNLKFFAQVRNITNYIYFNEQILPEQNSQNIQHILIQAEKDVRIGNWGTDLRLSYQNVSHPSIIRIPEFTGKLKLFYHNLLFDNALDLEIGVELFYYTKYYANRYMPALRSFHLQNKQEIGEYPFADVYMNAKIGKARLFVRYDHFNSSFTGNNYYASPDYPAPDASFRFGVSWLLFN